MIQWHIEIICIITKIYAYRKYWYGLNIKNYIKKGGSNDYLAQGFTKESVLILNLNIDQTLVFSNLLIYSQWRWKKLQED